MSDQKLVQWVSDRQVPGRGEQARRDTHAGTAPKQRQANADPARRKGRARRASKGGREEREKRAGEDEHTDGAQQARPPRRARGREERGGRGAEYFSLSVPVARGRAGSQSVARGEAGRTRRCAAARLKRNGKIPMGPGEPGGASRGCAQRFRGKGASRTPSQWQLWLRPRDALQALQQ
jgi:hypothetical protein